MCKNNVYYKKLRREKYKKRNATNAWIKLAATSLTFIGLLSIQGSFTVQRRNCSCGFKQQFITVCINILPK
jgi:hypothetical protein